MSEGAVPVEAQAGDVPPTVQNPVRGPSRRTLISAGAALLVVVVAVILGLSLTGGSKKDLTVTFSLVDIAGRSSCEGGAGGYSDIGPGTAVVVKDNDGHVIGTSDLGDGQHSALDPADGFTPGGCAWQTTVHNVPAGKDFYSVEVGHRGAQVYSSDQLDKRKWMVSLTLGS